MGTQKKGKGRTLRKGFVENLLARAGGFAFNGCYAIFQSDDSGIGPTP